MKRGRVTVGGIAILDPSQRIDPAETVVDGVAVEFPDGVLLAFHKPAGYVCTHDQEEGETIYDLLPSCLIGRIPAVTTVGRLDKDTSGLILLTDDGSLVQRWTSPKRHVEKVYEVECDRPIPTSCIATFASGELILRNETTPCLPAKLEIVSERIAMITVLEGRYHQVRRMFASQGCVVVRLHRTRVGHLSLGDLGEGHWRAVSPKDVDGN